MNITGSQKDRPAEQMVIAKVNGIEITKPEFASVREMEQHRMKMFGGLRSPLDSAHMEGRIISQLVMQKIALSVAQEQGIQVSKKEIAAARNKMIDAQIEERRSLYSNPNEKKKISDADFEIALRNDGLTLRLLRKEMEAELTSEVVKETLMLQKLQDTVGNPGKITDERLVDSFRQIKIASIDFNTIGKPEDQVKHKAEEVLKQLQSGADFAKLAKENSDNPAVKKNGVEAMWVPASSDPGYEGLKAGKISGLIRSLGGYQIVKVEEEKLDLPKDFEEKKKEYKEQLTQQLGNEALMKLMDEATEKAKIEFVDKGLNGYWLVSKAQFTMDPAEREKLINEAVKVLNQATKDNPSDPAPWCQLAEIYAGQDKSKESIAILENILIKRSPAGEGVDLRQMLAQLYLKTDQKDKAAEQFVEVSEMSNRATDQPIHRMLKMQFETLGRADLVANEEKWLAEHPEPEVPKNMMPPQAVPSR